MENANKNNIDGTAKTSSAAIVGCVRAAKLIKGCVVMMKAGSGIIGYGDPQCVSSVCEPLDEISLYGHNQLYKTWDIQKIVEYPFIEQNN